MLVFSAVGCNNNTSVYTQKVQELNQLLEAQQPHQQATENEIIKAIKAEVRKNGNSREGQERIKRAELLRERMAWAIDTLQLLKNQLSKYSPTATAPVRRLFWHNESGEKLAIKMDKLIIWLSAEFKDLALPKFSKLIQREFVLKAGPDHKFKFAQLHFAYGSVASTIGLFTYWQNTLLLYEYEVLKKLVADDITPYCGFTKVGVGVSTQSDIIKLGETYEAKMFITNNASRANPRATYNGVPINVIDGNAEVRFKARAIPDSVRADKITYYWEGGITFKNKGRDTTFKAKVPYTVLRKSVYNPKKLKK